MVVDENVDRLALRTPTLFTRHSHRCHSLFLPPFCLILVRAEPTLGTLLIVAGHPNVMYALRGTITYLYVQNYVVCSVIGMKRLRAALFQKPTVLERRCKALYPRPAGHDYDFIPRPMEADLRTVP